MNNHIEVKAEVTYEMFYNKDSNFGVYSFRPVGDSPIIVDDKYGTFVASGNCNKLKKGMVLEFIVEPTYNKRYGKGYGFVDFKLPHLNTVEKQQDYLKEVVAPTYADKLIQQYPNELILDLIVNDKVDVSTLKGIGESIYEKRIKNKVNEFYGIAHSVVALKDLKVTKKQITKLIEHFGSQELLVSTVENNIYSLCNVSGFGFKKVDDYAMKRGDSQESEERILAAIEYTIKEVTYGEGNSYITMTELKEHVSPILNIKIDLINKVLLNIKNNTESNMIIFEDKITLKSHYDTEKAIAKHLFRINSNYNKSRKIDIDVIESELDFNYTEEQRNFIKLTSENGVVILKGRAGTGKSATVVGYTKSLQSSESYIACALSGQAVKVLNGRGLSAATIHSLVINDSNLPYDSVIIDEMSMVDNYLFLRVLELIPNGTQLILVGDIGQLPAIGVGSPYIDLIESNQFAFQDLTIIHRQALESGILEYANKVYDGEQITKYMGDTVAKYGVKEDFKLFSMTDKTSIIEMILKIVKLSVKKYGESFLDDFIVLTANKKNGVLSANNLNLELRRIFNKYNYENTTPIGNYYLGDKVIHNGNNREATHLSELDCTDKDKKTTIVYNGSIGKIVKINTELSTVIIDFQDVDGYVEYEISDFNYISLAYAISCHRSQGIGIKNVLFTFDYGAYKLLSKNLVYTGMTRAIETLVMIVENAALHKAIKTDLSKRNTLLSRFILEN